MTEANEPKDTATQGVSDSAQLGIGTCGHFCEACARRDDEIKRFHEAVRNVKSHLRDSYAGVLRGGLRDNDSSRVALISRMDSEWGAPFYFRARY